MLRFKMAVVSEKTRFLFTYFGCGNYSCYLNKKICRLLRRIEKKMLEINKQTWEEGREVGETERGRAEVYLPLKEN